MLDDGYLSAMEAARALGVAPATLYAYVSRGLVRSERGQGRTRRYHAGDIAALRRGLPPSGPLVETAITAVIGDRVYFRGRDAIELAGTLSVREAAAFIWECDPATTFAPENLPDPLPKLAPLDAALAGAPPAARAVARLLVASANEPPARSTAPAYLGYTGARLLRFLTAAIAGTAASARPIEALLAEAWGLGRDARPLLRAALILTADEGVDAAAMTTRLATAAGMPPWRAVAAGLAALDAGAVGATDARTAYLLSLVPRHRPDDANSNTKSNLGEALAALVAVLELPAGAAAALHLLGRTIGLIAHVAEEAAAARPLRARGTYVGPWPEIAPSPQSGKG